MRFSSSTGAVSEPFGGEIARGKHLFPFRTEKLSPSAPMVLGGQPPGRVGRRRISFFEEGRREAAFFVVQNVRMEVRGERVVLRPWRLEDAAAVAAACQDPEIARWLPIIPSPYSESDAREFVDQSRLNWDLGAAYGFALVDDEGEVIGSIGVRMLHFSTGHIGYWVAPAARGRGVATNALKALSHWAVDDLGLKRLELMTDPENVASQRVAEKAGSRREGIHRSALEYRDGTRSDSIMFSLLAEELGGA